MKFAPDFFAIMLLIFILDNVKSEISIRRDCLCGESNSDSAGRIVNGVRTVPNKYPWMAAMFSPKGNFMCGGSVISDRNILTAGHCVFYTKALESTWILGIHVIRSNQGVRYKTLKCELHPSFVNDSIYDDYDMAIVTVHRPITFNHNVKPICLPSIGSKYVDETAIVAGWGKLGESRNAKTAEVLMETRVVIKSKEECQVMTKRLFKFQDDSMVCAYEQKTDACQGDSGGPLFFETEANRFEILGVVSFGDGCAREFPGIYGKLSTPATLKWIKETIEKSNASVCNDPPRTRKRMNSAYVFPAVSYTHIYPPIFVAPAGK